MSAQAAAQIDPDTVTALRDRALARLRAGEPVILLTDQPVLFCAARGVSAQTVNLMARHGRGLVCHAMDAAQMVRLGLALLPSTGEQAGRWRFATSYEAAVGCSTGISAAERALTLNAGAREGAGAGDIAQPGHIIPVLADPAGTAAPDRALRLLSEAGLPGGAVVCTLLDERGAVAGAEDARGLARALGLAVAEADELASSTMTRAGEAYA